MKLVRLHLHNYRNFEEATLDFGSKATLIFGYNDIGKSNLLAATKQLLSFVFSYNNYDEPYFQFVANSGCKVDGYSIKDGGCRKDPNEFEYTFHYPIRNNLSASIDGNNDLLEWTFETDSFQGGLEESLYKDAADRFWESHNYGMAEMPVFAYFSDSFPNLNPKIPTTFKALMESGNPLPRSRGYYKWDAENKNPEQWLVYFTMQYKNSLFSGKPEATEFVKAIRSVLIKSSKPVSIFDPQADYVIKDISVNIGGRNQSVMIEYENGTWIPFARLSSSELRYYSMVLDIACRSYLLNKDVNSKGIVLIDDIDMHLHPLNERTILKRLQSTFPRMQWIITTHSPYVIATFDQKEGVNSIYKLSKEGSSYNIASVGNIKGRDLSSILKIMGTSESEDETELLD